MSDDSWVPPQVLLAVDLVILTLRQGALHVLLVERGVEPYRATLALPGGFLSFLEEDIEVAAHRELLEEAGLDAKQLHLEQLGVYGAPGRDPRGRVVSVAYLAIAPRLPDPVAGTDASDAAWVRTDVAVSADVRLAFDHRKIVIDGVERARSKLEHSALGAAFCGPTFTIAELQDVYEAVWGVTLDPRNFYRKVQSVDGFIVPVGAVRRSDVGRPARLFRSDAQMTLHPPMTRPFEPAEKRAAQR
jgi:8-oxo-dGTP diphosphatase